MALICLNSPKSQIKAFDKHLVSYLSVWVYIVLNHFLKNPTRGKRRHQSACVMVTNSIKLYLYSVCYNQVRRKMLCKTQENLPFNRKKPWAGPGCGVIVWQDRVHVWVGSLQPPTRGRHFGLVSLSDSDLVDACLVGLQGSPLRIQFQQKI